MQTTAMTGIAVRQPVHITVYTLGLYPHRNSFKSTTDYQLCRGYIN